MEALLSLFLTTAPVQRVTIQFVKQSRNVMRQLLLREMFWMYPAHKGPIPKLLIHTGHCFALQRTTLAFAGMKGCSR